jgi:predicted DsbA family dithiol-disulfide isomerase
MVEAIEFPHLAQKYSISGVPKTVINEDISFVGALPEEMVVQYVKQAQAKQGSP